MPFRPFTLLQALLWMFQVKGTRFIMVAPHWPHTLLRTLVHIDPTPPSWHTMGPYTAHRPVVSGGGGGDLSTRSPPGSSFLKGALRRPPVLLWDLDLVLEMCQSPPFELLRATSLN